MWVTQNHLLLFACLQYLLSEYHELTKLKWNNYDLDDTAKYSFLFLCYESIYNISVFNIWNLCNI